MSKQDTYPAKSTLAANDYVTGVDSTGPSTIKILISAILSYVWTLANIPTGATSPITRDNETQFAFVASGGVWSGDSYGVNRNASLTALVCYINGRRISIAAVTARTFTASVDTYIDVLDNLDGTGTLVYTTAINNAASPALAANSIRIGIIITGATTIAAATSVNQGQETMVLPIASSIPYSVTDSLGNLICSRDPNHKMLGYRQCIINRTTTSATYVQIPELSCPVIVPTGRKIKATAKMPVFTTTGTNTVGLSIWDGVVASGTQICESDLGNTTAAAATHLDTSLPFTPTSSSKTYNAGFKINGGSTLASASGATFPTFLLIELE